MSEELSNEAREYINEFQKNEITEYHIYRRLADFVDDEHNSRVLEEIAQDELKHYNYFKDLTGSEAEPDKLQIWLYYLVSRLFGFTFAVKLMEKGEESAQESYESITDEVPGAREIIQEEDEHENQLLKMLDEERLRYVGSIVLGLNDALVELTGALAGYTLALKNTSLIALTGLITGVAASLSMGASEYLSTKSEDGDEPLKSSLYTGGAYVFTVFLLIFPYFLFETVYYALALTLFNAVLVILVFTFYISIAKDLKFKHRFLEMVGISLGVAALSFVIGYLIKGFLGVEV